MDLALLALILALAFANGTNDVSKAIATLVGSGITDYPTAIRWGTAWTIAGAGLSALVATAMVKTFSTGLVQPDLSIPPAFALAVLGGAMTWVLLASRTGLPVSTTHALTGAIIGSGIMAFGQEGLVWPALAKKIALPLLLSPLLAFTVAVIVHPVIRILAKRWEGHCLCVMPTARALVTVDARGVTRTLFQAASLGQPVLDVPSHCERAGLSGLVIGLDSIHWISSGLTSLARGANDAPKIVAMLLLGHSFAAPSDSPLRMAVFAGVALAMGMGSYWGGLRVTQMLAEKVTRMNHVEGLSANLTTSSLVMISATLGLPVSTTHISSSAIIGIGLLKGAHAVRWITVRDMVLAWIVTIPAAALLACASYLCLARIF
ncbi:MAG: inorganic phosphate transporter [Nitrospira sp.]|nr:inorganic phosphate transporter [Nitrospira sp.]